MVVARSVNGITINSELEFLLDGGGRIRTFDSEERARNFLEDFGVTSEELRHMKFMENE